MTGHPLPYPTPPPAAVPDHAGWFGRRDRTPIDGWVRRGCALVVAGVAAYSSYAHQRHFALDGGADQVSAALWPLSVDGLVILASTGLLTGSAPGGRRARWTVRLAFLLGVAASLAANIAAAPALAWQPILVAGWPPLALLLAAELLMHSHHRDRTPDTAPSASGRERIRVGGQFGPAGRTWFLRAGGREISGTRLRPINARRGPAGRVGSGC